MFAVSRFENRNGVTSWRVSGFLHGVRIRRNFKTREEAAAENAALELRALQATNGMRSAATFLADEQLRDAETAFRRLSDRPHSLLYYLDYALATHREPDQQKPLAEAVSEYVAFKTQEQKRTLISPRQLRSIQNELETLKKRFPRGPVSQFTPASLTNFFERAGPSLKTSNNRRGLLSTFFKFALQKDWIVSNPVEKTTHHRIAHRRGSADTLSAEQAMELMAYVESYQGGQPKTLSSNQRLFNRGYAVTSYGSQGKTVDAVLFADSGCRAATTSEQWYVTISRGRKRVAVFTENKADLRAAVVRSGQKDLALDLNADPTAAARAHAEHIRRSLEHAERYRRFHALIAMQHRHSQGMRIH